MRLENGLNEDGIVFDITSSKSQFVHGKVTYLGTVKRKEKSAGNTHQQSEVLFLKLSFVSLQPL
jgi:hypothetical protein